MATEEYAVDTGRSCGHCHVSESGGAELTATGTSYLEFLEGPDEADAAGPFRQMTATKRILRAVVGYVHVFTGFFWFGTILYVHIVLKPAYASSGLPRGEVRVGLTSMAIMGITGLILTLHRVRDVDVFVDTRFGILLAVKIGIYLAMVSSAMVAVFLVGPRLRRETARDPGATPDDVLTPDKLAEFDGSRGRRALIGYKDAVYDVTGSRSWVDGSHFRRHPAGTDLTKMLAQAPHGEDRVLERPKVAALAFNADLSRSPAEKAFYAISYFNLANVSLIILVLALWRWW